MSVIDTLVGLVERLYYETEGYADNPSDAQLWYNRGYANGVIAFLRARGDEGKLNGIQPDAADLYKSDLIMAWHKAYHHGVEMGEKESGEVFTQHN